jgi:hypothetical protein
MYQTFFCSDYSSRRTEDSKTCEDEKCSPPKIAKGEIVVPTE